MARTTTSFTPIPTSPRPAHNLAALTLGELGVPGLVLFGLLWLRWFGMGAASCPFRARSPMRVMGVGLFFGICGIFGQSLTEWVYRQTPIYLTFCILLGRARQPGGGPAPHPHEDRASGRGCAARPEPLVAGRM